MPNKDIIQELNDLGSSLAKKTLHGPYSVPEGYFEAFADQVLSLLRNDESSHYGLPKVTPYQVPAGYFDGLEERIMEMVRSHPDYQTSEEELEAISPLLSSLNKRPVYSVPDGYFENLNVAAAENNTYAKVIRATRRKGFRYAAAAVITGIIALAAFFIYDHNDKDPTNAANRTLAKFEKEVKKIDDVKGTETLIDFMDAGLNQEELATNKKTIKTDDVQKLLQDVSIDELKDFNEQSKDIEEVMMTN